MKKLVILLIGITIVMSMPKVTTINLWRDIAIGLFGGIIGYSTDRQEATVSSGDQSPAPNPGCEYRYTTWRREYLPPDGLERRVLLVP